MSFCVRARLCQPVVLRTMLHVALLMVSMQAKAVDYFNVTITGVGQDSTNDYLRFTIDQDPNVILTTQGMSGDLLKRMTALILTAYSTQTLVYFLRSAEASSSTSAHYSPVQFVSLGRRTHD